jgi:hypothetical protein
LDQVRHSCQPPVLALMPISARLDTRESVSGGCQTIGMLHAAWEHQLTESDPIKSPAT